MVSAIIVAAGRGSRMKHPTAKQYLSLSGQPILAITLSIFNRCREIDEIRVVVPKEDIAYCSEQIVRRLSVDKPIRVIAGGPRRQESVLNGLRSLDRKKGHLVAIHDGVRPFVTIELIQKCIACARDSGACIPAIQATDTLKMVAEDGCVTQTLDRNPIRMVQTPQVFLYDHILKAHESALKDGFQGTDDASLVERIGMRVTIVSGSPLNIKITTPDDLKFAQALFALSQDRR